MKERSNNSVRTESLYASSDGKIVRKKKKFLRFLTNAEGRSFMLYDDETIYDMWADVTMTKDDAIKQGVML